MSSSINNGNNEKSSSSLRQKNDDICSQTLVAFLKSKDALSNNNKKFLATAIWLESKGNSRIKTSEVSAVLKDAKQTKLGNPAECLNQNVSKGFCQKDGQSFFVTEDGRNSLGL